MSWDLEPLSIASKTLSVTTKQSNQILSQRLLYGNKNLF